VGKRRGSSAEEERKCVGLMGARIRAVRMDLHGPVLSLFLLSSFPTQNEDLIRTDTISPLDLRFSWP
jgi:hypothetical protein